MAMKLLSEAQVKDKRVIVRADYNVPVDATGKITDDLRLRASLPTIQYLQKQGALQIILMTHFGRPEGKVVEKYRVDAIARHLSDLLQGRVAKVHACVDIPLPPEPIVLLENLRFYAEEEADGDDFAKRLASHADIYVNDAFSVSHRAHASVHAIVKHIPSFAGLLLQREAENLARVTFNPKTPFVAIIGGAKADKIEVIYALLPKVDKLIIGGMLANTFLKAKGCDLGASKFTVDLVETAKDMLEKGGDKIVLPSDLVFADKFAAGADIKTLPVGTDAASGLLGIDIGEQTIQSYSEILRLAKTVFWAGPIGVFEIDEFFTGTKKICELLALLPSTRVIGGGDSAAAVEKAGVADKMTFMSTAGGASLEFVAGKRLPGLDVLGFY